MTPDMAPTLQAGGKDAPQPIFAPIFGEAWPHLPRVMHRHYANRANTQDHYVCRGTLDVYCSRWLKWLAPVMGLASGIPAVTATNIPVTVQFKSEAASHVLHFIRTFYIPGRRPHVFHTRMQQLEGSKVAEFLPFRLCWVMHYSWQAGQVQLAHKGYALRIRGTLVPLPATWLLGRIDASESPVSDTRFKMQVTVRHWLFGRLYAYSGSFKMEDTHGDTP